MKIYTFLLVLCCLRELLCCKVGSDDCVCCYNNCTIQGSSGQLTSTCDDLTSNKTISTSRYSYCDTVSIECNTQYDFSNFPDWLDSLDQRFVYKIKLNYRSLNRISSETLLPTSIRIAELDMSCNYILNIESGALFQENSTIKSLILVSNWLEGIDISKLTLLENLDMRDNSFRVINQDQFANNKKLKTLSLVYNYITEVHANAFDNNTELTYAELSTNQIKEIRLKAPKLEFLGLDTNFIEVVNSTTFAYLPSLRTLRLQNNLIKQIHPRAFTNLPFLRTLVLSNCQLTELPENVLAYLYSLTWLSISRNQISIIRNSDMTSLSKLTKLTIYSNTFKEIGETAFINQSLLTSIDLSNSNILNMTNLRFEGLKSLTLLTLSGNNVQTIRSNAFIYLKNLTDLIFKFNSISSIEPDAFKGLSSLVFINLASNSLESLEPRMFKYLTNLKYLNVSANYIKTIENDSFHDLDSLLHLNISYNNLEFIKNDRFSRLKNLTGLNLSHNCISSFEQNALAGLVKLETLDLSWNCIFKIEQGLFSDLKSLIQLDISHNLLFVINPMSFDLPKLKILDLSYNQLDSVHESSFSNLPSLERLSLQKNFLSQASLQAFMNLTFLNFGENVNQRLKLTSSQQNGKLKNIKSLVMRLSQETLISEFDLSKVIELDLSYSTINLDILKTIPFLSIKKLNLSNLIFNKTALGLHIMSLSNKILEEIDLSQSIDQGLGLTYIRSSQYLRVIRLSGVSLNDSIYENLFLNRQFSNLTLLDVSDNQMTRIRKYFFDDSTRIQFLYMSKNRIEAIDNYTFAKLTSLKVLDLSSNLLKEISQNNFGLNEVPSLKELYLANNRIENVSCILPSIMSTISLANNQLTELPEVLILFVSNIVFFDFNGNRLENVTKMSFRITNQLSCLYLSQNRIKSIEDYSFQAMSPLLVLDLSCNSISIITEHTFSGLYNLVLLNMSVNLVQSLNPGIFSKMSFLEELDLSHNQIKFIAPGAFYNLNLITKLLLGHNNLTTFFDYNILKDINNTIEYIYVPIETLDKSVSVSLMLEIIINSLRPEKSEKNISIDFYNTRSIVISPSIYDYQYNDTLCFFMTYLIRFNIQFNLYSEHDVFAYLSSCSGWSAKAFVTKTKFDLHF